MEAKEPAVHLWIEAQIMDRFDEFIETLNSYLPNNPSAETCIAYVITAKVLADLSMKVANLHDN